MNYQGKRKEQVNFSNLMAFIGMVGLILTIIFGQSLLSDTTDIQPGPPHKYWFPDLNDTLTKQDSLELKEPDAIYYDTSNTDNMLDIDMDCGENESTPRYSRFADVPAGVEDKIIVDDILYKMSDNKTKWIPVYPDEHVMWIGSNGDTIWE